MVGVPLWGARFFMSRLVGHVRGAGCLLVGSHAPIFKTLEQPQQV